MEPLDVESRRHHRVRCPVQVEVSANSHPTLRVRSFDVCTSGGSFELPAGECPYHEGDRVTVAVPLLGEGGPFVTEAEVRHCTPVPTPTAAPPSTRVGLQFRNALLLDRVAFDEAA